MVKEAEERPSEAETSVKPRKVGGSLGRNFGRAKEEGENPNEAGNFDRAKEEGKSQSEVGTSAKPRKVGGAEGGKLRRLRWFPPSASFFFP